MSGSDQAALEPSPALDPDPVIEAYKAGIDRTLIIENLRRTPAERLANLDALQRFAARFHGAARRIRSGSTK